MINKPLLVCILIGFSSLAVWATESPSQAQATLKSVMLSLSKVSKAKSEFTETRYIHILKSPLVSSGVLSYQSPDQFEKHTLVPIEEKMTIAKHVVNIEMPSLKKKQTIYPGNFPALATIVDALRGAMSGNLSDLERVFKVSAQGNLQGWSLNLIPIEAVQYGYVRKIVIQGRADFIDQIEIIQADGDRSVMSMKRVEP
jgi:Outer membrane lipoprotein carrier protein LolA-like